MKTLVLVLVLLWCTISFGYNVQLLTPEQIKSLSTEDQVRYMRGLQRILAGMVRQTPYMAESIKHSKRLPANDDDFKKAYEEYIAQQAGATNVTTTSPPMTSPAPTTPATPPTPEKTEKISPSEPQSSKPKSNASPSSSPTSSAIKIDDPMLLDPNESYVTPPPLAKPVNKEPSVKKTETPAVRKHFRCMYSGWVVEGPDCTGPQKIPDWLSFDGMKAENKSCPTGTVACMPLIFGLELPEQCTSFLQKDCAEQAKPVCVKRGSWPTVDCYRRAGDNKNRTSRIALELITEIAPQQYTRYQELFSDLCDQEQIESNPFAEKHKGKPRPKDQSKRIRDDISKTCEWAAKQIADLNNMQSIEKTFGKGKKEQTRQQKSDSKSKNQK